VLWIDAAKPWIEHIELQAGREPDLPDRVHWYSTILGYARKVPVHSTIILLRPAADGPELSGTFDKRDPKGDGYDWFRYDVLRVWQRPVDEFLAAGLPVLPLAPVSDVGADRLPAVLTAAARRFKAEASPAWTKLLWAATKVLMGLRYAARDMDPIIERISAMILGIRGIEEPSVYQDIFAKGRAEGLAEEVRKSVLLRQGRKKFGPPSEAVVSQLNAIEEIDRLNDLIERILDAKSWDELLEGTGESPGQSADAPVS
jgi:hypothetical protein